MENSALLIHYHCNWQGCMFGILITFNERADLQHWTTYSGRQGVPSLSSSSVHLHSAAWQCKSNSHCNFKDTSRLLKV